MRREMRRLEVETVNNGVELRQDYTCPNNCFIRIESDQIDTLIKWLREAQVELGSNTDLTLKGWTWR